MSEPRGRALVRAAWTLAVALAAILVLKIFVCDVKHVESASMEPTIFGSPAGGESVLVLYGPFEPERFDPVVVSREGETVPLVKRIVGLPKESVRISQGDLLVDGRRLPPSAPRPPLVPVFDGRREELTGPFEFARGGESLWSESGGDWTVDARELVAGSADGLMSFHRPLRDDYYAPDGSLVRGQTDVNDAIFECDVSAHDGARGGRVIVDLREQGDVFRFSLEEWGSEPSTARLSRRRAEGPEEILETRTVRLPPGSARWTRIRCSNVDNALAFEVEGSDVTLCHEYAENTFDENDRLREGKTFGVRVRFGGEGGAFAFRSVRILRDIHYVPHGTYGVTAPADLGPNEYFVLGDNSTSSRDSREWGPIQASRLVGRPVWVVWPLSAVRTIPAPAAGPCGR